MYSLEIIVMRIMHVWLGKPSNAITAFTSGCVSGSFEDAWQTEACFNVFIF